MLTWRLYYGDDTTFSNEQGEFAVAPARDVQALVCRDESVGRQVETNDFYILWPGQVRPWGVDWAGLLDYLAETGRGTDRSLSTHSIDELAAAGVKLGRSLTNERFREVHARACADPDFPVKSARYPHERDPS